MEGRQGGWKEGKEEWPEAAEGWWLGRSGRLGEGLAPELLP